MAYPSHKFFLVDLRKWSPPYNIEILWLICGAVWTFLNMNFHEWVQFKILYLMNKIKTKPHCMGVSTNTDPLLTPYKINRKNSKTQELSIGLILVQL